MLVSPEIIAEQVMGYVVWASELIPTLKPPSQPYIVTIVPQWPHFYTGLLQAAGYLLLDGEKKKLLVISEQEEDPSNIIVDAHRYWPVFGTTWEQPITLLEAFAQQIDAKISLPNQKTAFKNLSFQLPFLRVITETEELLNIGVGKQITQKNITKLTTWIKKNISEYNIVLLTNIELPPSPKSKKNDDQKYIVNLLSGVDIKHMPLLKIFQKITDFSKQKPEIIAYVNPSDFGVKWSMTTRYICAVG